MDIVILAHFTDDFSEGDNGRFNYLATMLANEHDVEIVTSDFDHITKKPRQPLQASMPYQVTFLHESGIQKTFASKGCIATGCGRVAYKNTYRAGKRQAEYCGV